MPLIPHANDEKHKALPSQIARSLPEAQPRSPPEANAA